MSESKLPKPPCKCQNSCQRGSGDKRVGCPCQDHDTICTKECQCGTDRWPCENILSTESDGVSQWSLETMAQNKFCQTRTVIG